jgi:minor extracellular serine protease Vpr
MKSFYFSLFICCLSFTVLAQEHHFVKPKLSPLTKRYLLDIKNKPQENFAPQGYIYKKHTDGMLYVSALIKVADEATAQNNLKAINVFVGTKAGNIWTVQVPLNKMVDFTNATGIFYIQIDEPVFPDLNIARKTTRVDSVQKGYGLPMPYSGKNVVLGIIDFGFDYNHPTMYDTLHAGYRVKKVWELNTLGTPPAGYTYGHELTDTNAIRAQGTDNPVQTHGTAVAGVAAGSGFGSIIASDRFRGMAYEADMVFVGVRRDSIGGQWIQSGFSDFIDGLNYIFNYATSVGKPAVVNISWGSQSGPHDGTSLFNQACDNLSGTGKIIVMAAGNDGQNKIHLSKAFIPTDTVVNTFLTFSPSTYRRTWVDIWGDTSKTFCASVTLYSNGIAGNTTNYICIDDSTHSHYLIGANGTDTCFIDFITSSSEFNDKPRMTLSIYNKATDSVGVSVKATSGAIDIWDEYYYYGFPHSYTSEFSSLSKPWAVSGNTISTVSDMGSANSVLLIGAYASKVAYTDINGHAWTYSGYVGVGGLVPFSSRGPMVDGRKKPDITAPGLTIATSMSSYSTTYTPTGDDSSSVVSVITGLQNPITNNHFYYAEFSGTSAASPVTSGIVALLLQANPYLTPQEIKSIIIATAIKDSHTGTIAPGGNNNWGNGKINAYGAIKMAIQQLAGVYNFSGKKLDCVLFPNPNNGGCTIDYTSDKEEKINIEILNITGSLVMAENWNVTTGNNQHPLDLSALSKGLYLVKVTSKEGSVNIKTVVK